MVYRLATYVPEIAAGCFIADSAQIIGKVFLGRAVSVWFGAVLRGDIEELRIGAGTNIQENSSLHTSSGLPLVIGENVTIGHSVTLHSCRIAKDCLIGMGATILDGAVIGEGSLVAAGSLVPPGKEFPPYSLIMGAPAERKKELNGAARSEILNNTQMYRELCERYNRDLVVLSYSFGNVLNAQNAQDAQDTRID